ncbi:MAG: ATP-binding protein [Rhodobacterales bacterium]|nr:ATP-binding protein [Rhodobacterales bacterium]
MVFKWLKQYMPRSLYARAALILVLPVVTLQLVVSVVFIQRHFEGVTTQMTQNVSRELDLLLGERTKQAPDLRQEQLADLLNITLRPVSPEMVPRENLRRWYDFSGLVVVRELNRLHAGILAIELPDDHLVRLFIETAGGPLEIRFDRNRVSAPNPHQLLVNMVFFSVLMTIIAYIYLRNQLRPITRLARAAEAFGRGRHLPYAPGGAIEVRAAGTAFLDMRARIERQIEQRTLLLSGVSHDLRTPLTRLKLGLALLEDEDRKPLERDVEDMGKLLDEFLSFARGASEGDPETIDPVEFITLIVDDSKRHGAQVTLGEMRGQGDIQIRPVAMRRAVENLINNAVRYGGRAEVSMVMTGKSLRIRVEDDGPGIPAERREEALRPFTRLDGARNQDKGPGVGLGLSIATDVARAHGGVLRLGESEKLGGLRADIVIAR